MFEVIQSWVVDNPLATAALTAAVNGDIGYTLFGIIAADGGAPGRVFLIAFAIIVLYDFILLFVAMLIAKIKFVATLGDRIRAFADSDKKSLMRKVALLAGMRKKSFLHRTIVYAIIKFMLGTRFTFPMYLSITRPSLSEFIPATLVSSAIVVSVPFWIGYLTTKGILLTGDLSAGKVALAIIFVLVLLGVAGKVIGKRF